ncbi:hypothetical protein GCM10027048_17760 [Hymenobacter coalescens]
MLMLTPDTSHYAIIPLDSAGIAYYKAEGRISGTYEVTLADIARAEAVLRRVVARYNEQADRNQFASYDFGFGKAIGRRNRRRIELGGYYRQYQGAYSPDGHRLLTIHGMCYPEYGWRKEVIEVQDGGNCYFSLEADLTDPARTDLLGVNGEA